MNRSVELVVGADGRLGRVIVRQLEKLGRQAIGTTRRSQDATASGHVFLDLDTQPEEWWTDCDARVAYFCTGMTSVVECEQDPRRSTLINVTQTVRWASEFLKRGQRVIYLSSDLVFDGTIPFPTPEQAPTPVTEYGRQKAACEQSLMALGGNLIIVRLSKVLARGFPLFRQWKRQLMKGEICRPYGDLFMSPISESFAADVIARAGVGADRGIVQVSASRDLSYADVCYYLAGRWKCDQRLVQPVAAPPNVARRFAAMDTADASKQFSMVIPDPIEALDFAADEVVDLDDAS